MASKSTLFAALIVIFALVDGITGACTTDQQNTKIQKCEKDFVDAMAKNANANCSTEMAKMNSCLTNLSKECYPKVEEKIIKMMVSIGMKQFQAMDFYCSSSKPITPKWPNVAPAIREKLSCQERAVMNEPSTKCSNDFRANLHKVPKDSDAIYRSYDESNKCMKKETMNLCSRATCTTTGVHYVMTGLLSVVMLAMAKLV